MPFFSRYTLAGVNAVKEVQVTGDMTDCTQKNGPPKNEKIAERKMILLSVQDRMSFDAEN